MSSQIKTQPNVLRNVVPEVDDGKSFLAELGVARFKWTIEDFKGFLDIGQTIKSPSFKMETTDPVSKVRSFHLEMVNPRPISNAQFPIFLVNETGGEILTKITREDFGPETGTPRKFSVSLERGVVVHKLKEKKQVLSVVPYDNFLPNKVTIGIKVTLCQPAETIQKLPLLPNDSLYSY
jgi:hypothetical protein